MNKTLPLLFLLVVSSEASATGIFTSLMLKFQGERIISALSVTTMQTSLSNNVISSAQQQVGQTVANARGAIQTNADILKAVVSYSPISGQPTTGNCVAFENASTMTAVGEQAERDAAKMMVSYSSARVASRTEGALEKMQRRQSAYCSVSEAQQGFCELVENGLQGADVNYSASIASAMTLAPEAEQAAYAYAAQLTDVRAEMQSDCHSAACEAAQARHMGAAAASSMAAASLIGQITSRRVTALNP